MIHSERFIILWDWDNTLVDTRPAAAKALKQLAHESGVPEPTEEQITNVIGTHFGQYWHNTYPQDMAQKLDRFLELYQEYSQDIQLFPETIEILSFFKKQGIRQFIASNKNQEILDEEVNRFGLAHLFEKVIGVQEHKAAKPSLDYAHKIFGQKIPQTILVVGDGESDMLFAQNIGATGLFIRPGTDEVPLPYYHRVQSLSEATTYLKEHYSELLMHKALEKFYQKGQRYLISHPTLLSCHLKIKSFIFNHFIRDKNPQHLPPVEREKIKDKMYVAYRNACIYPILTLFFPIFLPLFLLISVHQYITAIKYDFQISDKLEKDEIKTVIIPQNKMVEKTIRLNQYSTMLLFILSATIFLFLFWILSLSWIYVSKKLNISAETFFFGFLGAFIVSGILTPIIKKLFKQKNIREI